MKITSTPNDSMFVSTVTDYLFAAIATTMNMEFLLFVFAMGAYMVLAKSKSMRAKKHSMTKCPESDCFKVIEKEEQADISADVHEEEQQADEVQVAAPQVQTTADVYAVAACPTEVQEEDPEPVEEVHSLLEERSKTDDTVSYNLLLEGYMESGLFKEGFELLDEMTKGRVQFDTRTRSLLMKLTTGVRELPNACTLLGSDKLQLSDSVCPLVAVVTRAVAAPEVCTNQIKITGKLPQVRAACKGLKKHGFLKKCKDDKFQLNGHWVTEHGLNVVIEGKIVRWSPKRASRLKFLSADKRSCSLQVYGESTVGRLVTPTIPDAIKCLKWDNGDVWHAFDKCRIAHAEVFSQSLTKVLRDESQDEIVRARMAAQVQLVSKDGLGMLPNCMDLVLQFIGSDTFFVNINFDCRGGPAWMGAQQEVDFVSAISLRNPHVGFRHCWAIGGKDTCGQRTIADGKEVDDKSFRRLV